MTKLLPIASVAIAALCGCGEVDILAIDRSKVVSGIYLEAESGVLSGGFTVGSDPSASGGKFIEPPADMASTDQPGPARALYEVNIATAGTYILWGRIQSPDTGHNRFWVQVDGSSWYLWRITTGEIWYWHRIHNNTNYDDPLMFQLAVGAHTLLFANATDNVRLDRLYLTPGREVPPGNNTACRPPDSIQVNGACVPSCGSLGGNSCGVPQCSGAKMVATTVYDCQVCCIVP